MHENDIKVLQIPTNWQVMSTCEAQKTLEGLQESKMRCWKKGEMAWGRCGRRDLVRGPGVQGSRDGIPPAVFSTSNIHPRALSEIFFLYLDERLRWYIKTTSSHLLTARLTSSHLTPTYLKTSLSLLFSLPPAVPPTLPLAPPLSPSLSLSLSLPPHTHTHPLAAHMHTGAHACA